MHPRDMHHRHIVSGLHLSGGSLPLDGVVMTIEVDVVLLVTGQVVGVISLVGTGRLDHRLEYAALLDVVGLRDEIGL